MEVLNAHAEPIESQAPQAFQVSPRRNTQINLDSDFCVFREAEVVTSDSEQVLNLLRRQIRGSAAAPMKLYDLSIARNATADPLHLALQHPQIGRSDVFVLLNDHITSTEQA